MTWRPCRRRAELRAAACAGRVTAELRRHTAACGPCAELLLVMESLSEPGAGVPAGVDPALLWARARAARRHEGAVLASRAVTVARVALGAGLVIAALVMGATTQAWTAVTDASRSWTVPLPSFAPLVEMLASPRRDLWLYCLPGMIALASLSLWRWVNRNA